MKTILCFGDSNTWGSIASDRPTVQPSLRYDEHTRWPCVLGEELGPEYRVVEEGLSGRTTIYSIPSEAYKNGEPYLLPCLLSHRPLDLVIMMLGTNDLRLVYHADYDHLDKGIRRLIEIVQTCSMCGVGAVSPPILLVSPIRIRHPSGRMDFFNDRGGEVCIERASRYPQTYAAVAREMGCAFLDASLYGEPDPADGLHVTRESHLRLGRAVADKVHEILA